MTAGRDLTGKTALVTGVNAGIGYETMRVLASRGAQRDRYEKKTGITVF